MTERLRTTMTTATTRLAATRHGRVTLHVLCILAGSDPVMHWQGISREFRGQKCVLSRGEITVVQAGQLMMSEYQDDAEVVSAA